MDIDVRSQGAVKIIKLRGRLALGEPVERLRATMEDLLNSGENRLVLDLEELAQDHAYEFTFIFAPLRLKGATGSPGNPIAVR